MIITLYKLIAPTAPADQSYDINNKATQFSANMFTVEPASIYIEITYEVTKLDLSSCPTFIKFK
jgi:hypothetical protein